MFCDILSTIVTLILFRNALRPQVINQIMKLLMTTLTRGGF